VNTKVAVAVASAVLLAGAYAADPDALQRAAQPLDDGVPQVAVARLRELLDQKLTPEQRRAAAAKLVEALLAAGAPEEALTLLADAELRLVPGLPFLHAQALAAVGRWAEALPLFRQTSGDAASRYRAAARYGEAEALRALGRIDEAIAAYRTAQQDAHWTTRARLRIVELLVEKQDVDTATRVLDSIQPQGLAERKERRFLRGRVAAMRRRDRARTLYASVLRNPEGTPHRVYVATLLAFAEAHLQSHTPEKGSGFIEDFIDRRPADAALPQLFAKLDQLYAAERQQSRHELGRWANDRAQPRRAFAQWYLARANLRMDRRELALQGFEQLRAQHPPHAELTPAFIEYAQMLLDDREFAVALAALDTARALSPAAESRHRIELLTGSIHFAAERYQLAAQTYRQLARDRGSAANEALFDAGIAWLQASDESHVIAAAQELKDRGADDNLRGDLLLERGLVAASRAEGNAADLLREFLREVPKHPRASEAWVALAELAFHAAPPQLDEARQNLARAAESSPTPTAVERGDYLRVWLEDAAGGVNEPNVIARATDFLQKYPNSTLLPDVRMKLAETYFRRQDFAAAQTQFELLARRNGESPMAEKALFFAARSAAQTMGAAALDRALVLFEEVVKKNGPLRAAARNEQAMIERKLGKPQDALALYEEVIGSTAAPAEKWEAMCGKADVLYELGTMDAENYRRAAAAYEQLAAANDVPPHWRNQALFKKGVCLEKLGQRDEALAVFYRMIEDELRPGRQREYFWFYKAGFNAARLLEEASQWQAAAAMYEKLAFAGGARSEEAKTRLDRLRLEQFLWEE
jgi:hypothetical protein